MSDETPQVPAEIVDISALAGKFKNRAELQRYSEILFRSFKDSVQKLEALEAENKHLKDLLANSVPMIPMAVKFEIPDEQAIAEIQLKKLKETAMERDLTLDETKRMDLLVKNLYLSKGKQTSAIKISKVDEISEAELISLARDKNE